MILLTFLTCLTFVTVGAEAVALLLGAGAYSFAETLATPLPAGAARC